MSEVTSDPRRAWTPAGNISRMGETHRPPRIFLHIILFLATMLTTMVAGAFMAGAFRSGLDLLLHPWRIYQGIPFSFSILAILAAHEMGHYLMSRRHRMNVSLPYFLPGPFYIPSVPPLLPGTFGAVIRIRSPIVDKRALLDVGCSGPLSGILVVLPVLMVGLKLSRVATLPQGTELGITLGEPLLFKLMSWLILGPLGPNDHVLIHPVAFAGWLGLLITALNLLPAGQLDGGHVIYALFPNWHRRISITCVLILVVFGILSWQGWLLWAFILTVLGVRHPPPYCDWIPLDRRRRVFGGLTILIFALTFTPMPFNLE